MATRYAVISADGVGITEKTWFYLLIHAHRVTTSSHIRRKTRNVFSTDQTPCTAYAIDSLRTSFQPPSRVRVTTHGNSPIRNGNGIYSWLSTLETNIYQRDRKKVNKTTTQPRPHRGSLSHTHSFRTDAEKAQTGRGSRASDTELASYVPKVDSSTLTRTRES